MGLFQELKRRRVFRVSAAYIVAALAVLQGADTLFPALHLPPWTVTLVAVVVVLGFPVSLLLGWAFDVTPEGVTRTSGSFRFPARAAAVATIVLALAVTSFVALRRRAVAARVDANTVAVLPFRVSGDASLAALREGLVDLMAVKLTGEGGPRALDSRTTLSAWRRDVEDEKQDMPAADAVQLARRIGAGQALLGEVVGTPGRVVLSASLYSAIDGRKTASAEAAAPPDSILPLVDRVVAQLLSQHAGEGQRAEALLSESLPAVRAYLDGQQLLRRGDYETAVQRFNAALEEDSTFALAGLGLASSAGWTEDFALFQSARAVTLRYRDRLPPRDREFVDASFGRIPAVDRIAALRKMVTRSPDRVEFWYRLGDLYQHYGAIVGVEDATSKALDAWKHALALDSTYMPALEHQIDVYAGLGDTLNVRRVSDLMFRMRPNLRYTSANAWVAATALNDEAWLRQLRADIDSLNVMGANGAIGVISALGLPQQDIPLLIGAAERGDDGRDGGGRMTKPVVLASIGQPAAAMRALRELDNAGIPGWQMAQVATAWAHPEMDTRDLSDIVRNAIQHPGTGGSFTGGEYCLAHGNMACTEAAIRKMRAGNALRAERVARLGRQGDFAELMSISVAVLEAGAKVRARAPDARAALAHADSMVLLTAVGEYMLPGPISLFALASTRDHVALGDFTGAYEVAKRGAGLTYGTLVRAPLLLEYARLAARAGKRQEAVDAYRTYLNMRAHAEPGPARTIVEQARHELALVTAESR